MTTRLSVRYTFPHRADDLLAAMADPDFHDARVRDVGGAGSGLREFEHDPDAGRLTVGTRQRIERADLPDVVRRHSRGTLYADRLEEWDLSSTWSSGEFEVHVPGAPMRSGGRMSVLSVGEDSCDLRVQLFISVSVPLLGRTIERGMSGTVRNWLDDEAEFTRRWLDKSAGTSL